MLQLKDRPQWQTVKGGSASYIQAIQAASPSIQWKHAHVQEVIRTEHAVRIVTDQDQEQFDWVVLRVMLMTHWG
jgi:predicted NAD/FAD-binding protein